MDPQDPRVRRTHAHVTRVAGQLLLDHGWDQVTHAAVAEASGYSRATLYKHWPRPVDLLRAAFLHVGSFSHGEVRGELADDLRAEIEVFRRILIDEKLAVALVALADRATLDDEIRAVRDQFLDGGQGPLRSLLEGALRARGLEGDLALGPLADMLTGALVYRVAIMGDAVGPDYVKSVVDVLMRSLGDRDRDREESIAMPGGGRGRQ